MQDPIKGLSNREKTPYDREVCEQTVGEGRVGGEEETNGGLSNIIVPVAWPERYRLRRGGIQKKKRSFSRRRAPLTLVKYSFPWWGRPIGHTAEKNVRYGSKSLGEASEHQKAKKINSDSDR